MSTRWRQILPWLTAAALLIITFINTIRDWPKVPPFSVEEDPSGDYLQALYQHQHGLQMGGYWSFSTNMRMLGPAYVWTLVAGGKIATAIGGLDWFVLGAAVACVTVALASLVYAAWIVGRVWGPVSGWSLAAIFSVFTNFDSDHMSLFVTPHGLQTGAPNLVSPVWGPMLATPFMVVAVVAMLGFVSKRRYGVTAVLFSGLSGGVYWSHLPLAVLVLAVLLATALSDRIRTGRPLTWGRRQIMFLVGYMIGWGPATYRLIRERQGVLARDSVDTFLSRDSSPQVSELLMLPGKNTGVIFVCWLALLCVVLGFMYKKWRYTLLAASVANMWFLYELYNIKRDPVGAHIAYWYVQALLILGGWALAYAVARLWMKLPAGETMVIIVLCLSTLLPSLLMNQHAPSVLYRLMVLKEPGTGDSSPLLTGLENRSIRISWALGSKQSMLPFLLAARTQGFDICVTGNGDAYPDTSCRTHARKGDVQLILAPEQEPPSEQDGYRTLGVYHSHYGDRTVWARDVTTEVTTKR